MRATPAALRLRCACQVVRRTSEVKRRKKLAAAQGASMTVEVKSIFFAENDEPFLSPTIRDIVRRCKLSRSSLLDAQGTSQDDTNVQLQSLMDLAQETRADLQDLRHRVLVKASLNSLRPTLVPINGMALQKTEHSDRQHARVTDHEGENASASAANASDVNVAVTLTTNPLFNAGVSQVAGASALAATTSIAPVPINVASAPSDVPAGAAVASVAVAATDASVLVSDVQALRAEVHALRSQLADMNAVQDRLASSTAAIMARTCVLLCVAWIFLLFLDFSASSLCVLQQPITCTSLSRVSSSLTLSLSNSLSLSL
jgi:hypothetical protein